MRKQTKLVAVLSAAALLAIGASMTSFAAGWTQEDGTWVYLDRDGDRVTEDWKKSGANYYWLDEDGLMATDMLVEDDSNYYYVDANGVRVANQWVSVENEDGKEVDGKEVDTLWYYMGSSGKATKDKSSTISGKKYFFNDEGCMISGWYTDAKAEIYYLGDENEGWAYTGWQYLEPDEDKADLYENDEVWFYFQSSGKAHKNKRQYLNGKYYAFDENGVMITDWQGGTVGEASVATVDHADPEKIGLAKDGQRSFYDIDNGDQGSGWVYTYAGRDEDGDQKWFYLLSGEKNRVFNASGLDSKESGYPSAAKYESGKPKSDGVSYNVAAKIIKGKTYLFSDTGAMLTGVYRLEGDVKRDNGTKLESGKVYYFNKDGGSVEGQMVTGKTTITYDGDNFNYYFKEDGSAYTNILKNGSAYDENGVRIDATEGNTNSIKEISEIPGGLTIEGVKYNKGTIIVSSSGKVKKGKSTVVIDGVKYTVEGYLVTAAVDKDDNTVAISYETKQEAPKSSTADAE